MTKRLVDIDDDLLDKARRATGTATINETVNAALRHIVESELRLRHVKRLQDLDGLDLADDAVMADAWR